jgi:CBS-domain-containing membrane protein
MSSRNRDGDGVRRALKRSTWGPVAALLWWESVIAGIGGFIAILVLASARGELNANPLIAPFGASCVLVFAIPQRPLAQPRNVIGGHLISTIAGLLVFCVFGRTPLASA